MLGMPLAPLLKFDSSPHKSAVSRKDNQKRQMLLQCSSRSRADCVANPVIRLPTDALEHYKIDVIYKGEIFHEHQGRKL